MTTVTSTRPAPARVLCLASPTEDLRALPEVLRRFGRALVPAGGVGDLARAAGVDELYLVEVTADGPLPAVTWRARLSRSTPLTDPDPGQLLPASWHVRHPLAYRAARTPHAPALPESDDWDDDWDDEDEDLPIQVFVPIATLDPVPRAEWVFTNELVPKQQRRGRRFAPRVPTVVHLPD